MTGEHFDAHEAERLARNALTLGEELLDESAEIRRGDSLAREAAKRSRELSDYHARMIGMWEYLASAQHRGDMEIVRSTAQAIEKETRREFERRSQ